MSKESVDKSTECYFMQNRPTSTLFFYNLFVSFILQ